MALCRATGVQPSLLLHPLDFLDGTDAPRLRFFPAMGFPAAKKLRILSSALERFSATFASGPIREHVAPYLGAGVTLPAAPGAVAR